MSSTTMETGERPIRELMTPVPHSVTVDQTVTDVWQRMRMLGIRHLPITDEGRVVGVVSEREVSALCQGERGDPGALSVGDVMATDPCVVVGPEMPLLAVVRTMAERRAECCAVVDRGRLAGLLTTNDLIHLLAGLLLRGSDRRVHGMRPSDVRARILAEHGLLRELYATVEQLALRVLAGDREAEGPLRERCRELYQTLLRHMELEDTILAPALRETNAFGPVRAQNLLAEHERQRKALFDALIAAEAWSEVDLARGVRILIGELLVDMAHEEQALLHPDLLRDDVVAVDAATG